MKCCCPHAASIQFHAVARQVLKHATSPPPFAIVDRDAYDAQDIIAEEAKRVLRGRKPAPPVVHSRSRWHLHGDCERTIKYSILIIAVIIIMIIISDNDRNNAVNHGE